MLSHFLKVDGGFQANDMTNHTDRQQFKYSSNWSYGN